MSHASQEQVYLNKGVQLDFSDPEFPKLIWTYLYPLGKKNNTMSFSHWKSTFFK